MSKEIILPAGVTEAMVVAAKAKHGQNNVKIIQLPIDDSSSEMKEVLACVPSRIVVGNYRRWSDSDPKKADEILVKNCILSHLDEVLADDGLFYGALSGLSELIPVRKAVIKNL
ncbi:MAG: hypothetical protein RBS19_03270 [Bacteroidales bacterium]|nr:hypothetical protein [Bacteroidales bacterium]MDY0215958.1 hypothetical protein [Bacteroidales bacterium]